MQQRGLAPHETIEIHEIMTFQTACVGKATIMHGIARDPQLRSLLEEDVNRGSRRLQELQGIIQGAMNMQGR